MSTLTQELEPRATRRQWLGLFVIALPCMLYSMDLTVLNLALPALSARLHPTPSVRAEPYCLALTAALIAFEANVRG